MRGLNVLQNSSKTKVGVASGQGKGTADRGERVQL